MDDIVNSVLSDSEEQLHNLFWGTFGEQMEAEMMLEFMARLQLYAATCMREALKRSGHAK